MGFEELYDDERAAAWTVPPSLRVVVSDPRVTDIGIEVHAELCNDADVAVEVIVSGSYLSLTPVSTGGGASLSRRPYQGPPRVAAPPPPMRCTLGPRECISLQACLTRYEWSWTSGARAELEWELHFWNGPRPRGRTSVALL